MCSSCGATQPTPGGSCFAPYLSCQYGGTECVCGSQTSPQWACGSCPATQPQQGDTCNIEGIKCSWSGTNCTCMKGAGGDSWVCG